MKSRNSLRYTVRLTEDEIYIIIDALQDCVNKENGKYHNLYRKFVSYYTDGVDIQSKYQRHFIKREDW